MGDGCGVKVQAEVVMIQFYGNMRTLMRDFECQRALNELRSLGWCAEFVVSARRLRAKNFEKNFAVAVMALIFLRRL